jgi:hypothetical protein
MSAAPDGLGPLNFSTLQFRLLGTAFVSGNSSTQPDLFVAAQRSSFDDASIYLVPFVRNADDGAPIFGTPDKVAARTSGNGVVVQLPDGTINALWLNGNTLRHALYDRAAKAFLDRPDIKLPPAPKIPGARDPGYRANFAAFPDPDGSVTLVIETPFDPSAPRRPLWSSELYYYNTDGTSIQSLEYGTLSTIRLSKLAPGAAISAATVAPPPGAQYHTSTRGIAAVSLLKNAPPSIIIGSHFGNFYFFQNRSQNPLKLAGAFPVLGGDGILLRHPAISPAPIAYPDPETGLSNLLATSEGPFYFYKFTGNFSKSGAPIYKTPKLLLMENAPLYAGTLPSITPVDWDGDGQLDLISGNSDGFILFFKNIGATARPRFLPGVPVCTSDGKAIHIQPGYSGSLQGLMEARWGYLSPNAFDWNNDGLPDILLGDTSGSFRVFINRGTKGAPKLDQPALIYCDGIPVHGKWRTRPAAAHVKNPDGSTSTLLLVVDDHDCLHLHLRLDDFNVLSLTRPTLADGSPVTVSGRDGGGSGRVKLDLADYDGDGKLDLVIGTAGWSAIPNREKGLPVALARSVPSIPLLLRNTGDNLNPVYAYPELFIHRPTKTRLVTGGTHERTAILTPLGSSSGKPSLLTANEGGRIFLFAPGEFATEPAPTLASTSAPAPVPAPIPKNIPSKSLPSGVTLSKEPGQIEKISGPLKPALPPISLSAPTGDDWTLTLWFNAARTDRLNSAAWNRETPMTLVFLNSSGDTRRLVVRLPGGRVDVSATANNGKDWSSFKSPGQVEPGKWYFLTVVKTASTTHLYLDATLIGLSRKLPSIPGMENAAYGSLGPQRFFHGEILQPRIYSGVMSQEQIAGLYKTRPRETAP